MAVIIKIKKYIIYITPIIIAAFLLGCAAKVNNNSNTNNNTSTSNVASKSNTTSISSNTPTQAADPIKDQIKNMTLDEKIGQMVLMGFDGYSVGIKTARLIKDYKVGGFIFYSSNIKDSKQTLALINALKTNNKACSSIPLFLSVDEEGGRVSRLPAELKKFPTNKAIGEIDNAKFSYGIGTLLGKELKAFGFNVDFAPVMDINSNPRNPVIGDRSFGANEKIVSALGVQTMKGIQSQKVISVLKHFPGHGDTSVDSHSGLPIVNNSLTRLKSFELVPFGNAIKEGADMIMVAHILFPKIDPEYPSSFSKTIITGVLRGYLKFSGVVISDDLEMGAIAKNYSIESAAVKSIQAGNDICLVGHTFDVGVAVINALKKAVLKNEISMSRIDESVYRILKLKQKYSLSSDTIGAIDVSSLNSQISALLKSY